MEQIKIGEFIKTKRKEKKITQSELAEMLNITDRAVSKWENGICMPDSGTIPILCEILNITINDLFSGEVVDIKNNENKLENNLLDINKQKEESDKRLLHLEVIMAIISILPLLISIIIILVINIEESLKAIIVLTSMIPLIIALPFFIKIEQTAGYYKCAECNNKYIPTYLNVFFARHIGRRRYMICPKCKNKSWHSKEIKK